MAEIILAQSWMMLGTLEVQQLKFWCQVGCTSSGKESSEYSAAGVQLYLFDNNHSGIIPNNSVILSNYFGQLPRLQCVSGSLMAGVGQWLTPSGQNITSIDSPFDIIVGDENDPGYLDVLVHPGRTLRARDQGVYACRIPDERGVISTLHIGIYLPALTGKIIQVPA